MSPIPVVQVEDRLKARRDCVYLIPPSLPGRSCQGAIRWHREGEAKSRCLIDLCRRQPRAGAGQGRTKSSGGRVASSSEGSYDIRGSSTLLLSATRAWAPTESSAK